MLMKARDIMQRTYHNNSGLIGKCLAWLGYAQMKAGLLREAELSLKQTLRIYEINESYGKNSVKVGETSFLLSQLNEQKGDISSAIEFVETAIQCLTATYGDDHYKTKKMLDHYMNVLSKDNKQTAIKTKSTNSA